MFGFYWMLNCLISLIYDALWYILIYVVICNLLICDIYICFCDILLCEYENPWPVNDIWISMRQGVGFQLVIRNPHRIVMMNPVTDKFTLSINLWMKISVMGYTAYRYICDDWCCALLCVKPLDYTIHTQIWISRGNQLSHIFWWF